jgi:Ni,Fe-hydrogenase III small subunit/formate hydrogenlyase subunit 6/NADH:ubiquinone oxidoreductase subunit I
MLDSILARMRQGYRTTPFPKGPGPKLPDRFRGAPLIASPGGTGCPAGCRACADACPTGAIAIGAVRANGGASRHEGSESLDAVGRDARNKEAGISFDLGKCLFCGDCERACPNSIISHSVDYRLSACSREGLVTAGGPPLLATPMSRKLLSVLGRSLKLREVSAGGCNACEADANVLSTIGWDMGRFGIQFVASPRHADGLLVTGPVTPNMELALEKTWKAIPEPKIAIAVGACAISGGLYCRDAAAGPDGKALKGAGAVIPIDLYVPGCPPHPLTTLDGLLRILGRIRER